MTRDQAKRKLKIARSLFATAKTIVTVAQTKKGKARTETLAQARIFIRQASDLYDEITEAGFPYDA